VLFLAGCAVCMLLYSAPMYMIASLTNMIINTACHTTYCCIVFTLFSRLTFERVIKEASVGEFSCIPYILTLFSCLTYAGMVFQLLVLGGRT